MCQFSHISIGELVEFTVNNCDVCGHHFGLESEARYIGHETQGRVYDCFVLVMPLVCPGCKTVLFKSYFPCDDGPEICQEIFSRQVDVVSRD